MASKQVAGRNRSAIFVSASANTHADAIQAAIEEALSPLLRKGEKLPNVAFLAQLGARALERADQKMVDADNAHELEMADDKAPRETRDATVNLLYSKLVETSEIISGIYGASHVGSVKLDGATPREPALLLRYASTASSLLRTHDFGKARVKGASLAGKSVADEIDELVTTLKASLEDVAREKREGEATLVAKRASMEEYDKLFSKTATLVSALLTFVGQTDLASRVRPSTRKPGETIGQPDDEGEEEGDPAPAPQPEG